MLWQNAGMTMYVDWPAPVCVRAVQTGRKGGSSVAGYAGFNLALHVGDNAASVLNNRAALANQTGLSVSDIMWLNQVHSNRVVEWQFGIGIDADGCFTRQRKKACAVMTADCLPVLICNSAGSQVAAVHCGWRGLAAGILQNALMTFDPSDNLLVWLGPAIGPRHFEVGADVYQAFVSRSGCFDSAFLPADSVSISGAEPESKSKPKWLADIHEIARIILSREGVHWVYGGADCTFSHPERYYSYRRDQITGRMATLIWIE